MSALQEREKLTENLALTLSGRMLAMLQRVAQADESSLAAAARKAIKYGLVEINEKQFDSESIDDWWERQQRQQRRRKRGRQATK